MMLRYKVKEAKYADGEIFNRPVYVEAFMVTSADPEPVFLYGRPHRKITIEGQTEPLLAREILFAPINVGDYVRYDVKFDEYHKIDKNELANNKNLEKTESQGICERHVRTSIVVSLCHHDGE